jgi:DNA-directed RNA polymerase subunit F
MVKEIVEEQYLSIPEVKGILDEVFERIEHLGQNIDPFMEATYEYVHHFAKMEGNIAQKIVKMLMKDYSMENSQAIQIVNIDPQYPQEIKVILEKDPTFRDMELDDLQIMIQKIREFQ